MSANVHNYFHSDEYMVLYYFVHGPPTLQSMVPQPYKANPTRNYRHFLSLHLGYTYFSLLSFSMLVSSSYMGVKTDAAEIGFLLTIWCSQLLGRGQDQKLSIAGAAMVACGICDFRQPGRVMPYRYSFTIWFISWMAASLSFSSGPKVMCLQPR